MDEAMRGSISMFGQALPSLLQSLTAGRIAAGASRSLGKALSKRIPEGAMTTRTIKGMPQNITKRDDFINKIETGGMVTGMALNSMGMNSGEIYSSLLPYIDLPENDPDHVSIEDARVASLVGGAMSGSLDSLFPSHLLNKFMRGTGRKGASYWWRFVTSLPKNVVLEGATEGTQELINMMSEKYARGHEMTWSALTEDEKKRLIDAGALGAVGGMQGTILEALHDPADRDYASDEELLTTEAAFKRQEQFMAQQREASEELLKDTVVDFNEGDEVLDVDTNEVGVFKRYEEDSVVVDVDGEEVMFPRARSTKAFDEQEYEDYESGDLVSYKGDADLEGDIKSQRTI